MIWSVIGDLTGRLVQHDDYGHYGARKEFSLHLSKQLQNWDRESKLPVPWAAPLTHHRTQNDA